MAKHPNPFSIRPLADPVRQAELDSAALDEKQRAARPALSPAFGLRRLLGEPKRRASRLRLAIERESFRRRLRRLGNAETRSDSR